ncbi:hypothetical protein HYW32_02560 [Candidatus Berkelbacteria bacterium]|nr:hypothetical protein [Candidatus Berkelbacteria bacterium]
MNYKRAILWGAGIWAFVFVVAIAIFSLRENERPLFESIMPVALALATAFAAKMYFRGVKEHYKQVGLQLGLTWLVVNLVIDLFLFMPSSPMQMTLVDYLKDIGVTYLIIPIVTASMGKALAEKA